MDDGRVDPGLGHLLQGIVLRIGRDLPVLRRHLAVFPNVNLRIDDLHRSSPCLLGVCLGAPPQPRSGLAAATEISERGRSLPSASISEDDLADHLCHGSARRGGAAVGRDPETPGSGISRPAVMRCASAESPRAFPVNRRVRQDRRPDALLHHQPDRLVIVELGLDLQLDADPPSSVSIAARSPSPRISGCGSTPRPDHAAWPRCPAW